MRSPLQGCAVPPVGRSRRTRWTELFLLLLIGWLAPQQADAWSARPIRAERRVALGLESSWNGLGGVGPLVAMHLLPELSLDLAAGLSGSMGLKVGSRLRYNFLPREFTPFVGLGIALDSGTLNPPIHNVFHEEDGDRAVAYEAGLGLFVRASAGVELTLRRGFFLLAELGYAHLLNENLTLDGTPSDRQQRAIELAVGGGLALGITVGYAFGASEPPRHGANVVRPGIRHGD